MTIHADIVIHVMKGLHILVSKSGGFEGVMGVRHYRGIIKFR